jgi:hypothetical protein
LRAITVTLLTGALAGSALLVSGSTPPSRHAGGSPAAVRHSAPAPPFSWRSR